MIVKRGKNNIGFFTTLINTRYKNFHQFRIELDAGVLPEFIEDVLLRLCSSIGTLRSTIFILIVKNDYFFLSRILMIAKVNCSLRTTCCQDFKSVNRQAMKHSGSWSM